MSAGTNGTGDLVLDHVSYQPGPLLLDDVSVTFSAGRVTALSGPSGSGKTTLLSIAGGLVAPSTGAATYDGRATRQGEFAVTGSTLESVIGQRPRSARSVLETILSGH